MTEWIPEELEKFGAADEVEISSMRPDGTLRPFIIIWGVRAGDDFYVRSAYGAENGWFRRARDSGSGAIRAAGAERAVDFVAADASAHDDIDAAYRSKYASHEAAIVNKMVGDGVRDVTLRLVPRE